MPHCLLQLFEKLGRLLEPFVRKDQKPQKTDTLSPLIKEFRIFSENSFCLNDAPHCSLMQIIGKNRRAVLEKIQQ